MSCPGNPCEYMYYKVKSVDKEPISEEFTGDCDAKAKKALQAEFRKKLDATVQAQKEVLAGCGTNCECFVEEEDEDIYDDDEGWKFAGRGKFTETVKSGDCTLKKSVTYQRVAKKVEGHCYKPLPKQG